MHLSDERADAEATMLVTLPDRLTISDVATLQRSLLDAVASDRPVAIDGAQVMEIDTAGLQLLVSFWRSRRPGAAAYEWRGVSEPLLQFAQLIGVQSLLRLPVSDPGYSDNVSA